MKLLVCTYEFPPDYSSGAGNVAYEVVRQLRKMGVECVVSAPVGGDIELCSRRVIAKTHSFQIFDHLYRIVYFWHKAGKYVKGNHGAYDAVWIHNPSPITFRAGGQNSLVTMHTTAYGSALVNYGPVLNLYHKVMTQFEKHAYKNIACRFTGVSQQVCRELVELGVQQERITYMPNGVDTTRFRPSQHKKKLRRKFNLPQDDTILLSVGRLHQQKAPYKLIEVFSLINRNIKNLTLAIAGGGELLPGARKLAKEKGLDDVRFLGSVDHQKDLPDLYACSDYYITTSVYEGQPLTLLEAMASGLPCIVSDIPVLSSVVGDARCGVVVDYGHEEQAAQHISSYLKQDAMEHSRNAREYAANKLDWEIIARRYLHELEQVAKG